MDHQRAIVRRKGLSPEGAYLQATRARQGQITHTWERRGRARWKDGTRKGVACEEGGRCKGAEGAGVGSNIERRPPWDTGRRSGDQSRASPQAVFAVWCVQRQKQMGRRSARRYSGTSQCRKGCLALRAARGPGSTFAGPPIRSGGRPTTRSHNGSV